MRVAAYGAASVKAMPDLVRIRFKVVRLEQAPSQSFAHASDATHGVQEVLRRHGIPDRAVERSRLGLKSSWSFGPSAGAAHTAARQAANAVVKGKWRQGR